MEAIPELLARVADLMTDYPTSWALCGGWAVDAWLGRETREHCDVDLSVFHDEQSTVYTYLTRADGWLLNGHDAVDTDGDQPWDGRQIQFPGHVHAHADGFNLDVQLDRRDGDHWLFSRKADMRMPITQCVQLSPWGVPALVPPALLFYKAIGLIRPHDEADFRSLLPTLAGDERRWLATGLIRLRPGHPWLPELA